uniref:Protein kinase domain-containing protein n=1 Tax=Kalanchoe fedtschenkoi TaxID=63787 RepID=A0A7N0VE79_KALFE
MGAQRLLMLLVANVLFIACSQQLQLLALKSEAAIERLALLDLRSSLGIRAADWHKKSDPCKSWVGVECQSGRVTGLRLHGLRRSKWGRLNPRFSVDSIVNLTMLSSFNSSGFLLPGSIPSWFGYRLSALQVLDLCSSSVSGSIPESLGNMMSLSVLKLSDNAISGTIPATLGQLSSLAVLDLSSNLLTGLVPPELYFLRNLVSLDLSTNRLNGMISSGMGNFSEIKYLNLSDNGFSSVVPAELFFLFKMVELDLSSNSLSGTLPEVRHLVNLQKMNLGSNYLEGSLSKETFFSLVQLESLVLRNNRFHGALPNVLWILPKLHFLDVSGNQFTGRLPDLGSNFNATIKVFNLSWNLFYGTLAVQLVKFGSVDLSGNYFEGVSLGSNLTKIQLMRNCLQMGNQRSLEECRSFYADQGTRFDDFGVVSRPSSNSKSRFVFIMVGVFGGVLLLVVLVVIMWVIQRSCRHVEVNGATNANAKHVSKDGTSASTMASVDVPHVGKSFTYEQLAQSTSNFNEKFLIKNGHSGDLYRGRMDSGTHITVKKVDVHVLNNESYVSELKFFDTVSHPRLVPFLGHCLDQDNQKFLVYKYLPNGDLAKSFNRKTSGTDGDLQSLDWITRLKIATGVAEGLSYLHHECNPPLVHGDLKATSIILDDNFEVRLGSFGEVHAQPESPPTSIPEFTNPRTPGQCLSGLSLTTCAHDVYCFGKIMLELVTGKVGMSDSDETIAKEWLEQMLSYISISDKEKLSKILDPSLMVDDDLQEEVWGMALIARSCLRPNPSKRPLMKHILRALENPWKVVRDGGPWLRTTSSRKSWAAAFFSSSSWRQNSSEGNAAFRRSGTSGSHSSSGQERQTSRKKLSSEIFPEPADAWFLESQNQD